MQVGNFAGVRNTHTQNLTYRTAKPIADEKRNLPI